MVNPPNDSLQVKRFTYWRMDMEMGQGARRESQLARGELGGEGTQIDGLDLVGVALRLKRGTPDDRNPRVSPKVCLQFVEHEPWLLS